MNTFVCFLSCYRLLEWKENLAEGHGIMPNFGREKIFVF